MSLLATHYWSDMLGIGNIAVTAKVMPWARAKKSLRSFQYHFKCLIRTDWNAITTAGTFVFINDSFSR